MVILGWGPTAGRQVVRGSGAAGDKRYRSRAHPCEDTRFVCRSRAGASVAEGLLLSELEPCDARDPYVLAGGGDHVLDQLLDGLAAVLDEGLGHQRVLLGGAV